MLTRTPRWTSIAREWAVLGLFFGLTVLMLYPLSLRITDMVPEPTDPLLNAWRMQWNARSFLGGLDGWLNIFDTNIFYPYPLTLAYSEHFLLLSAQALPFLLVADSHFVGLNLSVLLTFGLSGYAMYLLVKAWTRTWWAGLVAGLLFAFSPYRFGQLNHLELLVTQWLPLALLTLHWTLSRPGPRYPLLFALFFNLQMLSGFHYGLNLTIACALLLTVYSLTGRVRWRAGLGWAGVLTVTVTLLLNWPIWQQYLRFSDLMGAVRTAGEVRVYSAALTDYVTAIPYNFLYGWTFGYWPAVDRQFQPLMPFGLVGWLLLIPVIVVTIRQFRARTSRLRRAGQPSSVLSASSAVPPHNDFWEPTILFLGILSLVGLLLSFGLNEYALGPGGTWLLRFSPYGWLYDHLPFFQAIRVPGRFGLLVVIGLVALAGWGAAKLPAWLNRPGKAGAQAVIVTVFLMGAGLVEAWSAPLIGPTFPAGPDIPPVYTWLAQNSPAEAVVLELPFREGSSEFLYEYYSSHHWRRLANGGTGYTPPIYREMRQWFSTFPDPRSIDVSQQLGLDWVILHADGYEPEAWQRLLDELPRYLPAIEEIHQIGQALALKLARPTCLPDPANIGVTLASQPGDALQNAIVLTYHNAGSAAFVADVRQPSHLTARSGAEQLFLEPLVTPAGETQAVGVPLSGAGWPEEGVTAELATLNRTVVPPGLEPEPFFAVDQPTPRPLGLQFLDGPTLSAYQIQPERPVTCGRLAVVLIWENGRAGDTAQVQLLDLFGRVVAEDSAQPWSSERASQPDIRHLPLPGSLAAGNYGLRVYVRAADGLERLPVTEAGVTIPTAQIPPLPVTLHPPAPPFAPVSPPLAVFAGNLQLLDTHLARERLAAGDWLRFSLVWQVEAPLEADLTVFTQLLGPDGQVWGQRDNQPGGGWYSTSLWLPGLPVVDDYAFRVPPEAPPGNYHLIVGFYKSETLERVTVESGGDFVEVATIQLE